MERTLFGGDGTLVEGMGVAGLTAVTVKRMTGCTGAVAGLKLVPFCMDVWDTTPCTGNQCGAIGTKVSGIIPALSSTHRACSYLEAAVVSQVYILAATNGNGVKDNPANRFIIALAANPHQNAVFDIVDDD